MPWGISEWEEIGIDGERLLKEIEKKREKSTNTLNTRAEFLSFIKQRYGLPDIGYLREFYLRYQEEFKICYILSKTLDGFYNEVVVSYYNQAFPEKTSDDKMTMLYELYSCDPDYLKKIFYSTYLVKKKMKKSDISDPSFLGFNYSMITREFCERIARSALGDSGKSKTVNVWYVLQENDSVTVFVYKKAKSRAKLPRASKKGYFFSEFSKPIIIQFSDNGRKVETYPNGKNVKNPIKLALQILRETTGDGINLSYVLERIPSPRVRVNELLSRVVREDFQRLYQMNLTKICFNARGGYNRTKVTVERNGNNPFIDVISEIKETLESEIDVNNVYSITLSYLGRLYQINIINTDEPVLTYHTYERSATIRREFETNMHDQFSVILNLG